MMAFSAQYTLNHGQGTDSGEQIELLCILLEDAGEGMALYCALPVVGGRGLDGDVCGVGSFGLLYGEKASISRIGRT